MHSWRNDWTTQPILIFQLEMRCGSAGVCSCLSNIHCLFLLSKQKSDESRLAGTRPSCPIALCQWCIWGRKSGSHDVRPILLGGFWERFSSLVQSLLLALQGLPAPTSQHTRARWLAHGVMTWCFELGRPPGDHGATRRRWQRGGRGRWCPWWHRWAAQSAAESLTSSFYISK